MTERLAAIASRHPWWTVGAWVLGVVLAFGVVATTLGDVLTTDSRVTSPTDSERAAELQNERFQPTLADFHRDVTEVAIVRAVSGRIDHAKVERLAKDLRAAGASFVATSTDDERLVSQGGDAEALLVALGLDAEDKVDAVVAAVQRVDEDPAYEASATPTRSNFPRTTCGTGSSTSARLPRSSSFCSSSAPSSPVSSHLSSRSFPSWSPWR
jgi:uncharacterized membrane protein YdfJ with MMPL/SSD domain